MLSPMGVRRATSMLELDGFWRVYFPSYALGGGEARSITFRWCRDHAHGKFVVKRSHIRFTVEEDALLCWLAFR
jgi:hypothetical protein